MNQTSLVILTIAVLFSVGMQVYSINKIIAFLRNKKGIIRSRIDLAELKEVINLNMKLAVVYIIIYVVFSMLIVLMLTRGWFSEAILTMFLFGIINLPMGLIGKHYEGKIKLMKIESDDKDLSSIFEQYMIQWKQARWKLPD